MAWKIEYTDRAEKALSKLDKTTERRVVRFLFEKAANSPRRYGKALAGPLGGFWSYRVGDYRVLAKIEDEELIILVVRVEHRSSVYGRH